MNKTLLKVYLVELVGTFAVVYLGAGMICVNEMTKPLQQTAEATALANQHPGLVGIALGQGLILAVALAATMHLSGGYLNPAITIMLWVMARLDSLRTLLLIGAQLMGAVLAGLCLSATFASEILQTTKMGTPHLNPLAFPHLQDSAKWWNHLAVGISLEFVLTFFLVFAIFGTVRRKSAWLAAETGKKAKTTDSLALSRTIDARLAALIAGLTLTACVLFGYSLTGACTNPARWFGTVLWEAGTARSWQPFADALTYTAGPILGALAAGAIYFVILEPELEKEKGKREK